MHVLEAGEPGRPCVLLLHGFPELAYQLAQGDAGAGRRRLPRDRAGPARLWPDHGLGRQLRRRPRFVPHDEPGAGLLALLVGAGDPARCSVVGHDFGSPVAAYCALTRPDVFRSVVLMSAPFGGPPIEARPTRASTTSWRRSAASTTSGTTRRARPTTTCARCPQGVHAFLRAYYHYKSADWAGNKPYPLRRWSAAELAKLPTYYVMRLDEDMAQTVAPHMPRRRMRAVADRRGARRLRRGVRAQRLPGRAAVVPLRDQSGIFGRAGAVRRLARSTCRRCSSPAPPTGASTRSPGDFERMQARPARTWPAATWSTAPATGCSRSSPR